MEIGPFNVIELDKIKSLLDSKNITYEVIVDKDLEEEILKKHHQFATMNPRQAAGTLDLKILFFEINDQDFSKIKTDLENYGVV